MSIVEQMRAVLPQRLNFEDLIPKISCDGPITVISDLHLPLIDEELFAQVINKANLLNSRAVFIVGDLYSMEPFSRHPKGMQEESFKNTLEVAHKVFDILTQYFDFIYISTGNHDDWAIKHNNRNLGMVELIRLSYPEGGMYPDGVGKVNKFGAEVEIRVYELPTMMVTVQGAKWVLEHPGHYSRIRTRTGVQVADKYGMNAAVGHVHHWGLTTSTDGEHLALELGGLFNREYFGYTYERPTAAPRMVSGFAIIDGEEAHIYRKR